MKIRWKMALRFTIIIVAISYYLWGGFNIEERQLFSDVTLQNTKDVEPPLDPGKQNIRLVSYNVWCPLLQQLALMNLEERIESLAEGIKEFDIALIQEAYILNTGVAVFSKCASHLVTELEKRGFHYRTAIKDLTAPYGGTNGGVIIFSHIPLLNTTSKLYQNYSLLQFSDYRGFVVGEFVFNSKRLIVVNTHLDPHQTSARISQGKELAAAIQRLTVPDAHIIVGGDFNIDNHYPTTSNSSKEYVELLKTMGQAGLKSVFPGRLETNTDGGNYDAIFASANVVVVKREIIKLVTSNGKMVSDHFGLAVELKLL